MKHHAPAKLKWDLPPDAISGARWEAEYAAKLFCDFVARHGIRPHADDAFPLHAALNVAAALRIGEWHAQNLTDHLPQDLPSGDKVLSDAITGLETQPEPRGREDRGASIACMYFRTWLKCFSWSAREELGVDVVLANTPQLADAGLEAVAEMLVQRSD